MTLRQTASMCGACTLVALATAAHSASVEWVGWVFPQAPSSSALGISGDGTVVVGSAVAGTTVPFRWTRESGLEMLFLPPPGFESVWAQSASEDGSVIIGRGRLTTTNEWMAWRWTEAGGFEQLGDLPGGGVDSDARDISADGTIIVGSARDATIYRAAYWTEVAGWVILPDLPGGHLGAGAHAISPSGQFIVGGSNSANNAFPGHLEATRWTNFASPIGLGDLPGASFNSTALAVSADGSVIAAACSVPGSAPPVGVWTLATGMVAIGGGIATDISADGTIIVGRHTPGSGSANRACIWVNGVGPRLLTTVLSQDYGIDTTGWIFEEALAVSYDGQVIVGRGSIAGVGQQGWVVYLPRPGACCFGDVCSDNISEKACSD